MSIRLKRDEEERRGDILRKKREMGGGGGEGYLGTEKIDREMAI